MKFTPNTIAELNLLLQFDMSSLQTGIKVHHDAAPEVIAAAQSLFDKGLSTLPDGGYLTDLGIEVAEHAQRLLAVLSTKPEHIPA
ncbi:DNA-binding protein [Agarivorans sp. OAG1]|uniref:DNA-binding protein inhibitor Id-2-related protein n=1 Tax=Agarivorans albus MKT 106 TaxID=1331007 RepID=R9PGW4_AGAAL|nr:MULTISPECIES: TIGR02647 family protein [Agarivorans]MPW28013.1 TIGR02647 family protein [Agarivorans sp. B2Z047]UQN44155.1 TIGR02647 family protein [Agarivorans sp. B2Z047]BEU04460.1 DNA-binding protein [Agarivorans sp. OAG1]GAD00615.1 DNA-binding protein inhibitor Id-2-related protein [Agarivorans albus MKT 106]